MGALAARTVRGRAPTLRPLDPTGRIDPGRGAGRYRKTLDAAGYVPGNDYSIIFLGYEGDSYIEDVGSFNLLRKIQLTFDLKPTLEVGLAYYRSASRSSWPGKIRIRFRETSNTTASGMSANIRRNRRLCRGLYKPLAGRLPKTLSWGIGFDSGSPGSTIA